MLADYSSFFSAINDLSSSGIIASDRNNQEENQVNRVRVCRKTLASLIAFSFLNTATSKDTKESCGDINGSSQRPVFTRRTKIDIRGSDEDPSSLCSHHSNRNTLARRFRAHLLYSVRA